MISRSIRCNTSLSGLGAFDVFDLEKSVCRKFAVGVTHELRAERSLQRSSLDEADNRLDILIPRV